MIRSRVCLPSLKLVLQKRLPQAASVWNIVNLWEKGQYSDRIRTSFYCSGRSITDDAIIVCVQHRKFPIEEDVIVSISGPCKLGAGEFTFNDDVINWSLPVSFAGIEETLAEQLQLRNKCLQHGIIGDIANCDSYYFPPSASVQTLRDRSDVIVKALEPSEGATVRENWKHGGPGTLERLEDAIKTIGSCGVYIKHDTFVNDSNGSKLVSWVTISHAGSINALHTPEKYRNLGYAKLAMLGITSLANRIGVPSVHIELDNFVSRRLMQGIGYKYSHKVVWINYHPRV